MFDRLSATGYKNLDVDTELPDLVAFVGDMTSGKSAYLEAIQLAATGAVHGVGERALADGIAGEVDIQLEGDGTLGTYHLPYDQGPKMRAIRHEHSGFDPESILPLTGLGGVANGGPSLESAIMARFGKGTLAVPESLQDFVEEHWPKASKTPLLSATGVGDFLAYCKKESAALGREIGKLNRQAEGVQGGATEGADLIALNGKLAKYDKAIADYGKNWVRAYLTKEHKTKLRGFKNAQKKAEEAHTKALGVVAMHKSVLSVVQAAAKSGETEMDCPLCGDGLIDVKAELKRRKAALALAEVKVGAARAEIAKAKRGFDAVLVSAEPDVDAWQRRQRELTEAATRQEMQTEWVKEAIEATAKQRNFQDAGKALRVAQKSHRQKAFAAAALRIDELSFPDFTLAIKEEGPRWVVQTKNGPRWGSLSGAQRGSILLAAPLVFGDPEQPGVILLDDDDFKGFSAKGVHSLLAHFASLQKDGIVSKVIVTHHDDRVREIPKSYSIVKV